MNIRLLILLLTLCSSLWATVIDVSQENKISILEYSQLYLDKNTLSFQDIKEKNLFIHYTKSQLNVGVSKDTIWIRFRLRNSSYRLLKRAIVIRSPRLEYITLYNQQDIIGYRGVFYRKGKQHTLYPFFRIKIPPQTTRVFYLKINTKWSPILFSVTLEKERVYREGDKLEQLIKIFLLGVIVSLMIYSLVLSFYTKDKSYLFYSFYLFTVIYQQMSYMGFSQIYLPLDWVNWEQKLTMPKIGLMIISTALFAMYFLKTWSIKKLHIGYQLIITLGIVEILFLVVAEDISAYNISILGKIFVGLNLLASLFNFFASIVYYRHGNREARLYIVGFGILLITYGLWTLSTLGFTLFLYNHPNTIILGTTIEAMVLSLAFADRYNILQLEKAQADRQILDEAKNREEIIKKEVIVKTEQLNKALETKEFLLQEVHHRVKNNLQIILSMIRLQQNKLTDKLVIEKLVNLENRVNAIAKTYSMLLIGDDLKEIDMEEYIELLLNDIERTVGSSHIDIITDIRTTIPLRVSVYVGLIINELVTNSYKYAFDDNAGVIKVVLSQQDNDILLVIEDNGKGYIPDKNSNSLGLKLIKTLVRNQLKGTIESSTQNGTKYIIRFKI